MQIYRKSQCRVFDTQVTVKDLIARHVVNLYVSNKPHSAIDLLQHRVKKILNLFRKRRYAFLIHKGNMVFTIVMGFDDSILIIKNYSNKKI